VEAIALEARARLGFGSREPIPDVVALLERQGAICLRREFMAHSIDAFSVPYGDRKLDGHPADLAVEVIADRHVVSQVEKNLATNHITVIPAM